MEAKELNEIIQRGEDSCHQFKADFRNSEQLAAELIAFSNAEGGLLIIGVSDDQRIQGLSSEDIARLNQLISNTATDSVRPAINLKTQNILIADKLILVVSVTAGINRPYCDNKGIYWIKNGADKRKVTAREELQRMFAQSGLIHADEMTVNQTSIDDLDAHYFTNFFENRYGESIEAQNLPLPKILESMNLMQEGQFNISGMLLFAKRPQFKLPLFIIKAVAFIGNDLSGSEYIDSRDLGGKMAEVFQQALSFALINIHHIQNDQNFNSLGQPEIPKVVFEELLVNALIHRDYFTSAPIRLLIFKNRIEIISPGHLPNKLTIENIKLGNSNMRNPILASFTSAILPYRGLGTGIRRAIQAWKDIDFIDDREGNQFKVIIHRKL